MLSEGERALRECVLLMLRAQPAGTERAGKEYLRRKAERTDPEIAQYRATIEIQTKRPTKVLAKTRKRPVLRGLGRLSRMGDEVAGRREREQWCIVEDHDHRSSRRGRQSWKALPAEEIENARRRGVVRNGVK